MLRPMGVLKTCPTVAYSSSYVVPSTYVAAKLPSSLPANQGPAAAFRQYWLHEIKLDGFRVIARKTSKQVDARISAYYV
jgi:hypothetical protein